MQTVTVYFMFTLINTFYIYFCNKNRIVVYRGERISKSFKLEIAQLILGLLFVFYNAMLSRLLGLNNSDVVFYVGACLIIVGLNKSVVKITSDSISNKYLICNSERLPLNLIKGYEFANKHVYESNEYISLRMDFGVGIKRPNNLFVRSLIRLKIIEKLGTVFLEIKCSDKETVENYLLENMTIPNIR